MTPHIITLDGHLQDGRRAFQLPDDHGIRKLIELAFLDKGRSKNPAIFRLHGITELDIDLSGREYGGEYYDCQDWVFDELGLPQYTNKEGGSACDELFGSGLPEFTHVTNPRERDLVTYFHLGEKVDGGREILIEHWGLVSEVGDDGDIIVHSKWGDMGVYSHPVGALPAGYGNYVLLSRKI